MFATIHIRAQQPFDDSMCSKLANRFAVACMQEKAAKTVFDVKSCFAVGNEHTAIEYKPTKIIDCSNFEHDLREVDSEILPFANDDLEHIFSICVVGVAESAQNSLKRSLHSIVNWNFPHASEKIAIRFQ